LLSKSPAKKNKLSVSEKMGKTGPLLATATVAGLQVMLLIRTQATQRITLCNSGAGGFGQVQQDNSESVVSNIRFLLLQDGIHMC
jgi:hypothetical protein